MSSVRSRRVALMAALIMCVAAPLAAAQALPEILGTDGDDVINGTPASEVINAGAGSDTVAADAGDDVIYPGVGNDRISGGAGRDKVIGPGTQVWFVNSPSVIVGPDGDQGDDVADDVEIIVGGAGRDLIYAPEGGNHDIYGGDERDNLNSGTFTGGDRLFGGEGNDVLDGRQAGRTASSEHYFGRNFLDCGPGYDQAHVDFYDVTTGCEEISRPLTPTFRLYRLFPAGGKVRSIRFTSVKSRSRVIIACRSGCRPSTSRSRRLFDGIVQSRLEDIQRPGESVRKRTAVTRIRFSSANARIVGGSVFEVGVTAPNGRLRCHRFKLNRDLTRLKRYDQFKPRCSTAASSRVVVPPLPL